jgi:hypothetical protein
MEIDMTKPLSEQELNDAIKLLANTIDVKHEDGKIIISEEHGKMLSDIYAKCCNMVFSYDNLREIADEHKILKNFIIKEGLYEKLINSDEFVNWMRVPSVCRKGEDKSE